MRDIAAMIHKATYGHSDKANAPENQSKEFQEGYAAGLTDVKTDELILQAWIRFGKLGYETPLFREYKRGMWAAKMQRTIGEALSGDEPSTTGEEGRV